ncbi:V-type ATP synthase subunit E [Methanocalculus sp. MC3]
MGLETIISLIVAETEEEIARIRQKAEEECTAIREAARLRVERERERILLEGKRKALRAERKVLLQAEYDEMKALRDARWQGIREVFVAAEEELADIPLKPEYPGILHSLIIEGREIVGGGEIVILCRAADKKAVEDAAEGLDGVAIRSLPLHDPQIQSGGVIVISADTPIRCDQTFATRLDQMRDSLTQQVSGILYGGEGDGY